MTADRTARLAAIRERCEKATPGPWTGTVHDYSMAQIHSENPDIWAAEHSPIICVSPCGACQGREEEAAKREGREPAWQWGRCTCPTKEDFDFLISSRADIPFLLTDNARLEAELAASEARVREARKTALEEAAQAVADMPTYEPMQPRASSARRYGLHDAVKVIRALKREARNGN